MDALETAVAHIHREFDAGLIHRLHKQRVRTALQLGTGHHMIQARYWDRAHMLRGYTLADAIKQVDYWYAVERPGLSRIILNELRLMLRLLRRSSERDHLQGYIGFLIGES